VGIKLGFVLLGQSDTSEPQASAIEKIANDSDK
jgi:hypothetical protein